MLFEYILNLFRQDRPDRPVESNMELRLIEDLTKSELDVLGKANGVRLDKRRKKEVLIAKLKEAGIYRG